MPLPIIGGLLAGAGAIYDVAKRSKDVKRQIQARKEEAEIAYQRSVEMWHMQNAYNSPEQQMERFGAAGLNPHLIYGQGSPGQAGSPPEYHPPEIQMQGASPPYGGAIASTLPTLMSVGTWLQNMRLSENRIQEQDQLVEFLKSKYPHEIRKFDYEEGLYPYQGDSIRSTAHKARIGVNSLLEEYRHLYGDDLKIPAFDSPGDRRGTPGGGMRGLESFLKSQQGRLTGLQADWYSPAAIMKMVLGSVGALGRIGNAGKAVSKTAGRATPKKIVTRFDPRTGRRVYQRAE